MAQTFRKRPIEIEAIHFNGTNVEEIAEFMGGMHQSIVQELKMPGPGRGMHDGLVIRTLEGDMRATPGDWIIRGVQGEYYPCRGDIFEATYEPVPQATMSGR